MEVKAETATFRSTVDGLELFVRSWVPDQQTLRGVVLLSHGYMEHCGRYQKIGVQFAERGVAVYAIDHRGHGRSGVVDGKRAYFASFANVVADFAQLSGLVRGGLAKAEAAAGKEGVQAPPLKELLCGGGEPKGLKLPFFVFAHSMGSLVATQYILGSGAQDDIKGVVMSAPFFEVAEKPNCLEALLLPLLAFLLPKMGLKALDANLITRNEAEQKLYNEDKLNVRDPVCANAAREFMLTHQAVWPKAKQFTKPLLIVTGTQDKLVDPQGSTRFLNAVGTPANQKALRLFEGAFHELFNETEPTQSEAISHCRDWVLERL